MKLNDRYIKNISTLNFLLVSVTISHAQWGRTPVDLIRLPLYRGVVVCSDGNGGCWAAASTVGLCHVDREGNLTWCDEPYGLQPGESCGPKLVLASNGDIILGMETVFEEDERPKAYIQRINLDQELIWGEGGIQLDRSRQHQSVMGAYPGPIDSTYLIHWFRHDGHFADGDPRLQLINEDGEFLWGEDGFELEWLNSNSHFAITSDQAVIVAQNVSPPLVIDVIKINPAGEELWDSRISMQGEEIVRRSLSDIEPDRAGGVILVYQYERHETIDDTLRRYLGINLFRVSDEGDSLWTRQLYEREREPEGDSFGRLDPIINYAGSGRYFVAWADFYQSFQVVAFNVDGEFFWNEAVDVILEPESYTMLDAVDSDRGVCYTWRDIDRDHEDGIIDQLFGQKINLEGERQWSDRGRAIQARTVWGSSITTDGNGGVITVVESNPTMQMINRDGEIEVVLEVGVDENFNKYNPDKLTPKLHIYPNPVLIFRRHYVPILLDSAPLLCSKG